MSPVFGGHCRIEEGKRLTAAWGKLTGSATVSLASNQSVLRMIESTHCDSAYETPLTVLRIMSPHQIETDKTDI